MSLTERLKSLMESPVTRLKLPMDFHVGKPRHPGNLCCLPKGLIGHRCCGNISVEKRTVEANGPFFH